MANVQANILYMDHMGIDRTHLVFPPIFHSPDLPSLVDNFSLCRVMLVGVSQKSKK